MSSKRREYDVVREGKGTGMGSPVRSTSTSLRSLARSGPSNPSTSLDPQPTRVRAVRSWNLSLPPLLIQEPLSVLLKWVCPRSSRGRRSLRADDVRVKVRGRGRGEGQGGERCGRGPDQADSMLGKRKVGRGEGVASRPSQSSSRSGTVGFSSVPSSPSPSSPVSLEAGSRRGVRRSEGGRANPSPRPTPPALECGSPPPPFPNPLSHTPCTSTDLARPAPRSFSSWVLPDEAH